MANSVEGYVEQHRDDILADLFKFLRIPSVSTGSAHRADVARCAEFVASQLRQAGLTRAEVRLTAGHPVVYGEWLGAPGRPTVLIYGHYDVQPPEPLELWLSPPFEPSIRDGDVYARGATDDKGQVMVHWKAVEAALKTAGSLPVNVKFIVEGEEEAGSEHLYPFVEQNRDLLAADVVVVSDTPWFAPNLPSLTYGLRGLVYFQLDVVGPHRDLHSGQFGGSVANPVQVLCQILAQLHDREGRVTIPGFYDRVRALTSQEREGYARLPFDEEAYREELGVPRLWGEAGFTTLERLWARPTLEINGIWGGYAGEGSKTVLPSRAGAKVSCRLVPDQDPDEIREQLEQCVRSLCPPTVELRTTFLHCGKPYLTSLEHPALQAAARALKIAFGREPVFTREGGSIPVVATFAEQLHAPTILMGFGLPDENTHAPNEHFRLDNFWGGIRASAELWDQLAQTP